MRFAGKCAAHTPLLVSLPLTFHHKGMTTPVPTDAELLDAVKRAIGGTLDRNAAAYLVNGKRLESLALTELLAVRADLETRVARAATGGYADVGRFQKAV